MTTQNMLRGRQVIASLTNQSGGAIIAGDVVIVSTANDESFTTTTSAAYNSTRVGVALESIAAAAAGRILLEGYAPLVNVSASATRGHYLLTHTVAKQATSQAGYAAGAFGQILKAGTTPSAMIFPVAQVGSAGSVATDPIWDAAGDLAVGTGADTAGRLAKGSAGAVLAMGNGAVIWNAGTSMPGSKATGDRYWRTDLGLEFYWDGTRWLSTTLYISNIPQYIENTNVQPFSTSPAYPLRAVAISDLYDMYIIDFRSTIRVNTTNNGTNYWTCTLENYPAATALASFNTSAKSADTIYRVTTAAGQLMGASNLIIWLHLVKTNSPGTVDILTAQYTYRLVGT